MFVFNEQDERLKIVEMNYQDGVWNVGIVLPVGNFIYSYGLLENDRIIHSLNRRFTIAVTTVDKVQAEILDEWVDVGNIEPILRSRLFENLTAIEITPTVKEKKAKTCTHIIKLQTLPLAGHLIPCIIGEGKQLHDWNEKDPLLMHKEKAGWEVRINLADELHAIQYKVALFDAELKKIIAYQPGENQQLIPHAATKLSIVHSLVYFKENMWKAAGLNVQLSSLRTGRSWGVGEFTDLFSLVDWVKQTGMQLIQLLPVNDTTTSYSSKDSYPYSAVSAFALHPMYLNVQKIASTRMAKIPSEILDRAAALNKADHLQYEEVIQLKWQGINCLFKELGTNFLEENTWKTYYTNNKEWLLPYAAFCHYRDKNSTANFNDWGENRYYNEAEVALLFDKNHEDFALFAIHLFVQYHLHLQLADATNYAHKNKIVFKADLPIGVGRDSVDTWISPGIFHMDLQAGAPPDAFAVKGQNWSFPTYNWEKMKQDDYSWWRRRMQQLGKYFDAVRIDHVLGFFRIWSIPVHAVEGILGRFRPAIPLSTDEFYHAGIPFSQQRFCEPFITAQLLQQHFGEHAAFVQETFLDGDRFKNEYKTQVEIETYFKKNREHSALEKGLFDLLANVILIEDEQEGQYHFRINIFETSSFKHLDAHTQAALDRLYNQYFFKTQDALWHKTGVVKLDALKAASDGMLLCGEDLGMVPDFVPSVLTQMNILSLQVERMPKKNTEEFSHPELANYDSVVTPGTHDMSTLRQWWEEDRRLTQKFYNHALGHYGDAPVYCEPWIAEQMIAQHMYSPAMLSVFLLQDLLAMNAELRRENPHEERINVPANPDHIWNYRMHINIEDLMLETNFNKLIKKLIHGSGRAA